MIDAEVAPNTNTRDGAARVNEVCADSEYSVRVRGMEEFSEPGIDRELLPLAGPYGERCRSKDLRDRGG